MQNGGKRPGAGRKKGGKNRLARALADAVSPRTVKAVAAGISPLEFLLSVMRDQSRDLEFRMDAAGKALPYLHKRQPQDITIDAVFQTPPPVLFVYGPPPEMPDAGPDASQQPN